MSAYYNENDPFAAEMLRNLIKAGHIAPGFVDERSILDVMPDDLREFTQCHFFAGVGVWSYALRRAGWPDDRPVWTGSCPCQPFSAAGKGAGFDDERHLWPAFFHLIGQRKPASIFGEQVASKPVDDWIDLVQADLEAVGYAFGCVPFPSAGVGAPHIRDRAYWVANSNDSGPQGRGRVRERATQRAVGAGGVAGWLADTAGLGRREQYTDALRSRERSGAQELEQRSWGSSLCGATGPVNGHWSDADWLYCRDGKFRPVEPGTFPLAHGAPARVGRLRAYGNAINAEAAAAFIRAAA